MNIVHLTASPFFGGPERQILGLARSLPAPYRTTFLSFAERGLCQPFLDEARCHGFTAEALLHNTPHAAAAAREVTRWLRLTRADVLCCHGYKADLVGLWAARRRGVPVVAVSRGWTAATWRVRVYEWLDRRSLPRMDAVVCVSEGQARKVRGTGVAADRLQVIRNAIDMTRFPRARTAALPAARGELQSLFATPRTWLVGAAGRLSPEKGFDRLVEAAALVVRSCPRAGFVLFGDGPLRERLVEQIARLGLEEHFVLAGFCDDLDRWLPGFDVTVLPSYTEGLPNVVLESLAAHVPVVATAVGGTPEVVQDGVNGCLVPPGHADALAGCIRALLSDAPLRRRMAEQGHRRVREQFTFAAQARQYQELFETLTPVIKLRQARRRVFEPAGLLARRVEDSPTGLAG
jgi:glycosyltransferase involved in cell wall biosynthesis